MHSLLLSHAFKCTAGPFCTQLPRCDLLCVYASSFASLFPRPQPRSILCHPSWNACERNIPFSHTWGHRGCSNTVESRLISLIGSGCCCGVSLYLPAPLFPHSTPSGVAGPWVLWCRSLAALLLCSVHHLGKVLMQHGRGQTAWETQRGTRPRHSAAAGSFYRGITGSDPSLKLQCRPCVVTWV